jgi:hypothetical protein
MPTVTVHFGGICTFFMADQHAELDGFCRVVLVNAGEGRTVAGHDIPAHVAVVQIGDDPPVPVLGLHMNLHTPSVDSPLLTLFADTCPNLTGLVSDQNSAVLSEPSQEVVFGGDPEQAALYFDFKGGTLQPNLNELGAVVTTLVMQGDHVVLETKAFPGGAEPPASLAGRVFDVDTTIWVSNDDATEHTSKYDFYLHYLTAQQVPADPPIPKEPLPNLPFVGRLPHWFGAIGAGCSNSTYP